MEPSSVRTTWLCFAVLCSGAAFALNGEELRHQSTTKGVHVPETMGDPTTTTEDEGKLMTWPMATLTPLVTEVPVITLVPTQADAAENKTHLGALDPLPIQDTIPIIPAPQEERKGLEKTPEDTETNFSEPSPPVVPQPDTPTAAGGLRCPGELEAD
ncbi:hypothetical protein AV530_008485 [Patagioenas fasciata monilis]|uniref:Uncharacterized protein n=1 Tax=Patagioenas fasciata monilis TaxID=372326 RepID=A0A1V4L166_PATFA|nr:hypothetical protein AV530_008485 [Patagioenas fasciata monilis]